MISSNASKTYLEQGFHIEEDLFTPAECAALVEEAEQYRPIPARPWMQPHRSSDRFLAALKNHNVLDTVEILCGGLVSGLQTTWFYGSPGGTGWRRHQDNSLVQAPPDAFVAVWCAMTDITKGMGGLSIYPGSHKESILQTVHLPREESLDSNADYECILPKDRYSSIELEMKRGSGLFMHGHLVHESGTNTTSWPRYALLMTYIRQGQPFRSGNTATRKEINVYGIG